MTWSLRWRGGLLRAFTVAFDLTNNPIRQQNDQVQVFVYQFAFFGPNFEVFLGYCFRKVVKHHSTAYLKYTLHNLVGMNVCFKENDLIFNLKQTKNTVIK